MDLWVSARRMVVGIAVGLPFTRQRSRRCSTGLDIHRRFCDGRRCMGTKLDDIGTIYGRALGVWWRAPALIPLCLGPVLVIATTSGAVSGLAIAFAPPDARRAMGLVWLASVVIGSGMATAFVHAAIAWAMRAIAANEPAELRAGLSAITSRLPWILVLGLRNTARICVGLVLCVLPGFVALAHRSLVLPVAMGEARGIGASIERARELLGPHGVAPVLLQLPALAIALVGYVVVAVLGLGSFGLTAGDTSTGAILLRGFTLGATITAAVASTFGIGSGCIGASIYEELRRQNA